jgi:hypothetical protein
MAEKLHHAHHSSLILHEVLEAKPMNNPAEELLKIHLFEYYTLKNEQAQRIGFRDHLLYAMLVAFGGVCGYVFSHADHLEFLLALPWFCVILGWTYVVNDQKISAIGRYIRLELSARISELTQTPVETLLGWETGHRNDPHRKSRKIYQLLIDEIAFVGSGLLAVGLSFLLISSFTPWMYLAAACDVILLSILAYWLGVYADLGVGSGRTSENDPK